MKFKAAVIQIEYSPGDKARSLGKIEKMLDECKQWGVRLACLQEYVLTGYPKVEWAEMIPGPTIERLARKCKECGIYLAAGSMVEEDKGLFYSTVPFIGPDGELIGKYRKINIHNSPPKMESDIGIKEGEDIVLLDTPLGKVGLLSGSDLDPCEPCRILALKDCDVLLAPHSCKGQYVDAHRYVAACRAIEGMFYVMAPNACGTMSTSNGTSYYLGSSRIVSPLGETLANAGEFGEGIAVALIDLEARRKMKEGAEWKFKRFPKAYRFLAESIK
jgi:predicted amidohydrolase